MMTADQTHRGRHDQCPECDIVVSEMIDWLLDCDLDIVGLGRVDITRFVAQAYDGGLNQFLIDGNYSIDSDGRV